MPPQVITIERRKYAVGLFWQPVASGQKSRNFAASISKQIPGQIKYFAEYKSMVGIGSRALGHSSGMRIAAVEVINSFSEYNSFLAAFFVPQGFWVVAVRNNIIIFDSLFSDEVSAKREYLNLAGLPDWGALIAPGYWAVPRAVETPLRDVVVGNSKVVLKPIGGAFGNMLSVILIAILVLGLWYFLKEPIAQMFAPKPQQLQMDAKLVAEYQRQLAEKNKALYGEQQPVKIQMPFDDLPSPAERADQCWRAIAYVMQPISGWAQTTADCVGLNARTHLVRTFGTLEGLYNSVGALMLNSTISENSDSDVIVNVPLPKLDGVSKTPTNSAVDIIFSVNTLFQTINSKVNIKQGTDTVRSGNDTAQFNFVSVSAASKLKPDEFMKIFDGFEPLDLTSVKWDAQQRIWNYEVIIYAK